MVSVADSSGPCSDCTCLVCRREARWDEGWARDDQALVQNILRVGWAVVGIDPSAISAAWAFSVGIFHTFCRPELAMFGLRVSDMEAVLNLLANDVKNGVSLRPGEERFGVIDKYPIQVREVHPSWARDLFGWALWFYRSAPPLFLQVVWPDRNGRFPSDSGCEQECQMSQPMLWIPKEEHPISAWTFAIQETDWPFAEPQDTEALTTKRIAFKNDPVLTVSHDPDGTWQFLDGQSHDVDDLILLHLRHVMDKYPEIGELADLPVGMEARRKDSGSEWSVTPIDDSD